MPGHIPFKRLAFQPLVFQPVVWHLPQVPYVPPASVPFSNSSSSVSYEPFSVRKYPVELIYSRAGFETITYDILAHPTHGVGRPIASAVSFGVNMTRCIVFVQLSYLALWQSWHTEDVRYVLLPDFMEKSFPSASTWQFPHPGDERNLEPNVVLLYLCVTL